MLLDFTPLPGFLLASLVVILTPGVDMFLLLRTSLQRGIKPGLLSLAGIHTGSAIQVMAVICGLGTVVTRNPAVLSVLKWVGAAYLLYLTATILRGLWLTRKKVAAGMPMTTQSADRTNPYLRGLLSNITNPKMLLFSLAFLPQFVGSALNLPLQLILLGTTFLGLAVLVELGIVLAASPLADRLRHPRVARSMDMVSAVAFLTISAGLVTG